MKAQIMRLMSAMLLLAVSLSSVMAQEGEAASGGNKFGPMLLILLVGVGVLLMVGLVMASREAAEEQDASS